MEKIVDKTTITEAVWLSESNLTANITVLAAQGIENKKNTTYFITSDIGKNATANIPIAEKTINLKKHAT